MIKDFKNLMVRNRSCRRFRENHAVDIGTLRELVDLAGLSAPGADLQPLKYVLSFNRETNARVFSNLAWVGYLKDWPGPDEEERPSPYIIILDDRDIGYWRDSEGVHHVPKRSLEEVIVAEFA